MTAPLIEKQGLTIDFAPRVDVISAVAGISIGIDLILMGIVVLGKLVVNLLYRWLDPRTRVRTA